jgi:PAS domain S-box-containing protein
MAPNQVNKNTPEELFVNSVAQSMLLFKQNLCVYHDKKITSMIGDSTYEIRIKHACPFFKKIVSPSDLKTIKSILEKTTNPQARKWMKSIQIKIGIDKRNRKWFEVVFRHLKWENEWILQTIFRDVDQQRTSELTRVNSEVIYRTILDNTAGAVILSEADMTIKYANRRFCQVIGKPKKAIEGKIAWTDFIDSRDRQRMMRYHYWRRAQSKHKAPRNYEFNLIDKNGQVRPCLATVSMIPGTTVSVATFIDITERIKDELAVKQSKKQFKSAFDHAPLGILLINQQGRVEQINRTCAKMLDVSREQIVTKKISKLINEQILPKECRNLCRAKKINSLPKIHFKTHKGKSIWLDMRCACISQSESNQTWMVMLQDVTREVDAQKIVEGLPNRLLEAHEEEKQLLSQEIHDTFSQSLAALKMAIQTAVLNQTDISPVLCQVDQLINLSRSISHNLRPEIIDKLGLVAAIHNLLNELSVRAGFPIQLKTNSQAILLPQTIALQLFRITQEAVVNAIKHSRASIITVSISKRKRFVSIRITDNGKGFEMNQNTSQLLRKKSLGLKIIHERAHKIAATCTIKSVVGKGTVILITCPIRHVNN